MHSWISKMDQVVDKHLGGGGRAAMLINLANTDAHFKHQQRGDPDLSVEEKVSIASEILDHSSALFLSKYYKYLDISDTAYFNDELDKYEVKYYIDLIKKEKSNGYSATRVKNRRYEAMKEMLKEGEYFSDDMMKHRDPYLHYQMVGQYQTEEEAADKIDKSDLKFSTILLSHMDMVEENTRFTKQKDKEVRLINPVTPTNCFSLIQNNEWKSQLKLISVEKIKES